MQKLPIGIQTFRQIREENYLYIDKTALALDMIESYKYVFLSRPRRFGKSLFLDTLHTIFEGKKEYFKGLAIEKKWDWNKTYPVIKIDWAGDFKTLEKTEQRAIQILKENQTRLDIQCEFKKSPSGCFEELIYKTYKKYQKPVVILVDEYDKPILDNLETPEKALENRDFLRSFYVMMKSNDASIKFVFLTGVSKFSKANIFSGLNNLEDISLIPKYGNICGYTQNDIETSFMPYLKGIDLKEVKAWYNGYNFMGENIYNPFDILKFIKNGYLFDNYWWESGNPYFLIMLLKQKHYHIPNLENITVGTSLLNSFEIETLRLEVLLFQSGYLTIAKQLQTPLGSRYTLKVPNKEVQISLNALFLQYFLDDTLDEKRLKLYEILSKADMEGFKRIFVSLFAGIANNHYTKNNMAHYEGYYASVFYAYVAASGMDITAEDVTSTGRIDMTITLNHHLYIIEFKVGKEDALAQIKEKNYAKKYLSSNQDIYLVGINFDESEKNIQTFAWEKLKG